MLNILYLQHKLFTFQTNDYKFDTFLESQTMEVFMFGCVTQSNVISSASHSIFAGGWSGGAMVLSKLVVPGRSTILITVGQGPIALAVGAGGGGLDIFTLIYPFSSFSLSLGIGPI